jgi:hypothetical protein
MIIGMDYDENLYSVLEKGKTGSLAHCSSWPPLLIFIYKLYDFYILTGF